MVSIEKSVQKGQKMVTDGIKTYVYDLIIAIIMLAIVAASLDILDFIDLTTFNLVKFIVDWIPYFMAAILLNNTLYNKGGHKGKSTTGYKDIVQEYSKQVGSLTGKQIESLYPFVDKYNEDALIALQTEILKKEGLTYEGFCNTYIAKFRTLDNKVEEKEFKPLKEMNKSEMILAGLNKDQIKAVKRAKNASIKGLNVNQLLSSLNIKDRTDIGNNETELQTKFSIISTFRFILATTMMALIAVKDIREWGWAGAIVAVFKVAYVFSRCFMSYFRGFNDITIKLASHIERKTDILKMFINWTPESVETEEKEETILMPDPIVDSEKSESQYLEIPKVTSEYTHVSEESNITL